MGIESLDRGFEIPIESQVGINEVSRMFFLERIVSIHDKPEGRHSIDSDNYTCIHFHRSETRDTHPTALLSTINHQNNSNVAVDGNVRIHHRINSNIDIHLPSNENRREYNCSWMNTENSILVSTTIENNVGEYFVRLFLQHSRCVHHRFD
jgi:hypothetical protein